MAGGDTVSGAVNIQKVQDDIQLRPQEPCYVLVWRHRTFSEQSRYQSHSTPRSRHSLILPVSSTTSYWCHCGHLTLLRQLHPQAIPQVAASARTCSSGHISLHKYMESYLIDPIHSLSYPYPLVIVVDVLDELEHHEAFLKELEHISQPSSVKILLTSRPKTYYTWNTTVIPFNLYPLQQKSWPLSCNRLWQNSANFKIINRVAAVCQCASMSWFLLHFPSLKAISSLQDLAADSKMASLYVGWVDRKTSMNLLMTKKSKVIMKGISYFMLASVLLVSVKLSSEILSVLDISIIIF